LRICVRFNDTYSLLYLVSKNFIQMKKELTKKDYDNYMKVVNQNIKETERRLENLDKSKKVSQLSFEDWVKFQNGELKIS